jgi:hypothetical protein
VSPQELTLFDVGPAAPRPASPPLLARRPRREGGSHRRALGLGALPGAAPPPTGAAGRPSSENQQPRQRQLPPTLDVVTAGAILGVGRTVAYRLVRHGQWPTHVVRVGRKIVIPTLPLLEFLGINACDVPDVLAVSTGSRWGLDPVVTRSTASPHRGGGER